VGLYEILEKTEKNAPEKTAVICGDHQYSNKRLKERVDRLSSSLKALDIQKNDRIAIIHRNCHRYLEAYYATAKIGAILVPVNFRLNAKDFVYILNDSLAKVLIAQPDLVSCLEGKKDSLPGLEHIILTESVPESVWPGFFEFESLMQEAEPSENKLSTVDESDTAQIYYTSGTTGRSKGVVLTHKNNSAHADGTIRELKLSAEDRWLHVSPMFHLADAWAVWAITRVAATHVMVPGFEPESVLEAIENHRITLSNFIPTMLNILVNHPQVNSHDFSSLRLILSGGAPIAKEVVRKVIEVFGCGYIQTYGLTETSPFLTMSILKEEMHALSFEDKLKYMASTGRPFDRVRLKIVKKSGEDILPNEKEVGEIIAMAETITPGYWRLPEETTQRIVNGWFHTRDLAVVNPEGYVTIVDRMDDVIVTGGENVYSIEVENVLYSHPNVLEAAVIGLSDRVWGEKVTAVIVAKPGEKLEEDAIIQFCKENMAPFKAPKKVIFTNHLPKTGSAKICKFELREKYGSK
jgi:fatty-acyl-CoA synthase